MGLFFTREVKQSESINENSILNEVYFGKTPNILKMQEIISKIRTNVSLFTSNNMNSNPLVLEFNRLAEDEFGFECFALYILPMSEINAMTLPVANKLDIWDEKKQLFSTGNGFKYDKKAGYSTIVAISTGLLANKNLSDAEVMGIILHEIGHSFTGSISGVSSAFGFAMKGLTAVLYIGLIYTTMLYPILLPTTILATFTNFNTTIKKMADIINKANTKNSNIWKVFNFFNDIKSIFQGVGIEIRTVSTLLSPINRIFGRVLGTMYHIADPTNLIHSLFGYNDEKVSDNFAAMYGYGPEKASAIKKMVRDEEGGIITRKVIYNMPIIGHLYRIIDIPLDLLSSPFECHPETVERIYNNISYLQSELKRGDLDPKMKKVIAEQLRECEDVLDDITNTNKKLKAYNPKIITSLYDRMLLFFFKGDVRDLFYNNQKNYDDYNKSLEDAIQREKMKKR